MQILNIENYAKKFTVASPEYVHKNINNVYKVVSYSLIETPKDLERVQDAVDRGADTKFAIFDCLNYGNLVLMEYLLQKKISDPNEIYHHLTALQTTIKLKMGLSAIKILVENGANIQNILGYAVRYGNIKIVQYLIEKGAGLENLDENQHTPLFFAARKGKREMVHLLLESGAAVEPAGHRHRYKSPLHIAVKHGYVEQLFDNNNIYEKLQLYCIYLLT